MKRIKQPVLSLANSVLIYPLIIPLMSTPAPTPACSPFLGSRMAMTGKRGQRTRQGPGEMGRELEEMKPAEILQGREYSQHPKLQKVLKSNKIN